MCGAGGISDATTIDDSWNPIINDSTKQNKIIPF